MADYYIYLRQSWKNMTVTDSEGNTETYRYDRLLPYPTEYITAQGDTIRYKYDSAGNMIEIQDELGSKTYAYNSLGHRTMLCDEEGNITRYYYDAAANITKEILPNGYDKRADDGTGNIYEYDVWENLNRVVRPDGGTYVLNMISGEISLESTHRIWSRANPQESCISMI